MLRFKKQNKKKNPLAWIIVINCDAYFVSCGIPEVHVLSEKYINPVDATENDFKNIF